MKTWTKFYLCIVVLIYSEKPAFYRQKPRRGRREKIRGANAPLISTKEPRIRGSGCGSAARMWPLGHIPVGSRLRKICAPFVRLDLLFELLDLTKRSLIVGFNHLIWEDPFQPIFNLSDLPRSALIP